jgi:glycosyltransferase involved in cell wall biosynthesis
MRVKMIAYLPEPIWPRGTAHVGSQPSSLGDWAATTVGYTNLPAVREMSLGRACLSEFRRVIHQHGPPNALISYNARPAYATVAEHARRELGIPWIPIVADVPEQARAAEFHSHTLAAAAGVVYLSWAAYLQAPDTIPRLHLDGGVSMLPERDDTSAAPILMYAGTLSAYGGLDLLLAAFVLLPNPDVRLWVSGKGKSAALAAAAAADHRVTFLGLVTDSELSQRSRTASVFVNPRPARLTASQNNFPSKVLEYLSYGKPVVSTWTPGLEPSYRDVLLVPAAETPAAFATRMKEALTMPPQDRLALRQRITRFLESRLWTVQAGRLAQWARAEVGI